jgi:hypothetical protein
LYEVACDWGSASQSGGCDVITTKTVQTSKNKVRARLLLDSELLVQAMECKLQSLLGPQVGRWLVKLDLAARVVAGIWNFGRHKVADMEKLWQLLMQHALLSCTDSATN